MKDLVLIESFRLAIEDLANTSSSKEKLKKLGVHLQEEAFRTFVKYALDGGMHYNMNKVELVRGIRPESEFSLKEVYDYLDFMSSKYGATAAEKKKFGELMCASTTARYLFHLVLNKDLKCGVKPRTANKAFPGLITVMSYQRCSLLDKIGNIKYPAFLEEKGDGAFCNTFVYPDGMVVRRTRNGNRIPLNHLEMDQALVNLVVPSFDNTIHVVLGEMRMMVDGEFLPRKESNGIFLKIMCGTATPEEHWGMTYAIWNIVPYNEWVSGEGKLTLQEMQKEYRLFELPVNTGCIHRLESRHVSSEEEAFALSEKWITESQDKNAKREGGILKNYSVKFSDSTSTQMIKLVAMKICELRIVDWNFGDINGKWFDKVGSLVCESEDGLLKVNVGGGLTDDTRDIEYWEGKVGKIISVKFNEVITKKDEKVASLFRPRLNKNSGELIEFRDDKTEADTFAYIKKL